MMTGEYREFRSGHPYTKDLGCSTKVPTEAIWYRHSCLSQSGATPPPFISFNQKDLTIAIRIIFLDAVYIHVKVSTVVNYYPY